MYFLIKRTLLGLAKRGPWFCWNYSIWLRGFHQVTTSFRWKKSNWVLTFGVFRVIPSYLVRREHILWKNNEQIILGENIFSIQKINIPKNIFLILRFLKFRSRDFPKSQNREIFFGCWFFGSKKYFFTKNIFSLLFHKICSLLTKYEGITPKTPKVRLIFRFLAPSRFLFANFWKYRGFRRRTFWTNTY